MASILLPLPVAALAERLARLLADGRKQAEMAVPGVPGLRVIAYASGKAAWLFRGKNPELGTKVSATLGDVQNMSFPDAVAAVALMRQRIVAGRNPRDELMPVSLFFKEQYLTWAKKQKRSWRDDVSRFTHHVLPAIGDRPLRRVTTFDLQRLLDGLPAHLADATVNRVLALLKAIFSRAQDWGFVDRSPATPLKSRRERNERQRVVRDAEFGPLFRALADAKTPLLNLLVHFLLATGVRLSEALTSRWCNLDIDSDTPTILLPDTKGGRSRIVPLSPEAVAVCRELSKFKRNEYLFPGRYVGHMARPGKAFKQVLEAAGIEGLTLHDFRRTFGSLACNAGVPIYDVSKLLGHSSVLVTARYAVVRDERLHSACATVGKLLSAAIQSREG